MINLLLGGPGGGKSYEAVAYHVLPALQRGRKVITNLPLFVEKFEAYLPGSAKLLDIRSKTLAVNPGLNIDADEDDQSSPLNRLLRQAKATRFVDRPFAHPEDFSDPWRGDDGIGPLYVVDECHFSLPKVGTKISVEEWFSLHRHYNADVLLITQSAGKISVAIKDLVQVCIKVRKAIALGRSDSYIRKVLDGVNGGEVSTTTRKYRKEIFGLYRSHTQGFALAEQEADDVAPLLVRFNRWKYAIWGVAVLGCIFAFWFNTRPKVSPVPVWLESAVAESKRIDSLPHVYAPDGSRLVPGAQFPASSASAPAASLSDSEPFKSQGLHLTGWISKKGAKVYSFAVSGSGSFLFAVTDVDLIKAGYRFEPLGDCFGRLTYGSTVRNVVCDAPKDMAARDNNPVVMSTDGTRSDARKKSSSSSQS